MGGNPYCVEKPSEIFHHPRNVCSRGERSPDVVILVSSAYGNNYKRFIIRRTWGKLLPFHGGAVKYLFLLGTTKGYENQTTVDEEQEQYGDILQGGFMDTYRNLTLKTLMGFRWFRHECPSVRWLVKTDDDVYISPGAILDFVRTEMAEEEHSIVGTCTQRRPKPQYPEYHRWYVSEAEYPDAIYPPYCCGCGYIITGNTARDAYDVMQWMPIFPLEDVFTGVALARLPYKVRFHNEPSRFPQLRYRDTKAECQDLQRGHVLAMHHVQPARTYLLTRNCKYNNSVLWPIVFPQIQCNFKYRMFTNIVEAIVVSPPWSSAKQNNIYIYLKPNG